MVLYPAGQTQTNMAPRMYSLRPTKTHDGATAAGSSIPMTRTSIRATICRDVVAGRTYLKKTPGRPQHHCTLFRAPSHNYTRVSRLFSSLEGNWTRLPPSATPVNSHILTRPLTSAVKVFTPKPGIHRRRGSGQLTVLFLGSLILIWPMETPPRR